MNHYLYLLTFEDGMKYVGARSCNPEPKDDVLYLGSGRHLPSRTINSCHKEILATFPNRQSLLKAETAYIDEHDCVNSKMYYNKRRTTYDKHGKPCTHTVTNKVLAARDEANAKRKQYVGTARTPAQKADDERKRGKKLGANPLKGHEGTTNQAFVPWFFIDTEGNVTKVLNTTKRDYAKRLGLTPRQLTHRFHHTNINKPAKQGKCKGYIFGNLEDLERVLSNEQY